MNAPLWFHNLLAYGAQVALLAATGELLPRIFRLRLPRVLLLYWQALLAVCLALPWLEPWRHEPASGVTVAMGWLRLEAASGPAARQFPFVSIYHVVMLVLLAGIGARFLWLATGLLRLRFCRRRALPLHPLPPAVEEIRSRLGLSAHFCVSAEIDSPVTCGEIHPAVLFPRHFLEMEPGRQKAIACHELLHVRRHDWAFHLVEEALRALFWFHPAVWWLVSRIRLAREEVVDSEVIQLLKSRKAYLEALLDIATAQSAPKPLPAPLFLAERQLPERVATMLKEVSMSKPRLIASLAGISSLLLISGGLAVWSFPLETPAGVVLSAPEGGGAQVLKPVHKVPPVYPEEAKKLRIQGKVILDATVNEQGEVIDLRALEGPPLLVKAALDAAKQWRFSTPAQSPAHTTITVNFSLREPSGGSTAEQPHKTATTTEEPLHVGGDVTAPVPVFKPEPPFPPRDKKDKIQGAVVLLVTIDAQGNVTDVRVAKSLRKDFDEIAMKTVKTWKFTPAMRKGKPVPVRVFVETSFRLF